ncbi:NAD(P)-dependent oxidoreductase [Bradyrhizobium prioriisuperbiae]|uniref:NAD(P)-dependent oxidoreductase n=1 Tax=Bradyrhizobium prioriisuperbiae TaxID=2854389 RepID=UPI0028ED0DFB|nr:NAD(P)-dependent oxidoreductase [Bradyrhizobium prioritasuperba]
MKIGVCGTGKMGSAIALRLIEVDHEVAVWNRNPDRTKPLIDAGAKQFGTPAELAGACEIVISMLLNDAASDAVYNGPDGLLTAELNGKLLIDTSTVLPETNVKLGSAVVAAGAGFVECPVGGTVGPARQGKLLGFAGGTAADVARAKPVLEQLCRRVEHVGAVGAGATMKLAVNLPLLVYWQALGESLAICKSLNLPPEKVIDILSDTSGTPVAMKGRGPDIAKLLAGETIGAPAFAISAAKKDLATAVRFAETQHTTLPVAASALACFEKAEAAGLGDADAVAVPVFWANSSATSRP